ncbi:MULTISPECIES: hypothetical protein [Streptomyces]|uniref:hypothetical protein n=1 Tax=Streptomyces TaxID=1883 RepID=UPI000A886D79|nr:MULTISPECIES: hypothetical protein [Streptomyces]
MLASVIEAQVRGLLVGKQAGDGLDDVARVLAAAEVAGQCPPVLEVGDAVLDADAPGGMRLALSVVRFLVPARGALPELPGRSS